MLVFAMTAHEYAHAAVALHEGDDTAYVLGRVTLNPIPHIDPWMSIVLPALLFFASSGAFTFGGAKPVPINSRKFRHYRRGDILVSSAGVVTNFVLALAFSALYVALGLLARSMPGAGEVLQTAQQMMLWGIRINLILCFFNLIPIPPLDGSHLLYHILPPQAGAWYRGLSRFGYLPLFVLLFLFQPVLGFLLTPVRVVMGILVHVIAPYQVVMMGTL
ncbi:MAG TPA: site-2 protease family protein [Gemmatimonadales bacterium]|jgi:Zn-dependent protease|nr:site-2 protease family protein [Gemmatimonadales bacterium]